MSARTVSVVFFSHCDASFNSKTGDKEVEVPSYLLNGMDTTILCCNDFNPSDVLREDQSAVTLNLYYVNNGSARDMREREPVTHWPCFEAVLRGSSLAGLRTLHHKCASWGFVCPVHTPDGAPCGLLNQMTASCIVCRYLRRSASSLPILQLPICSGTWVPKIEESNRQPLAILRPNSSLRATLNLFV
ncbi:sucrose nonfermenting 4-like protein [Tanacetum coccineum]